MRAFSIALVLAACGVDVGAVRPWVPIAEAQPPLAAEASPAPSKVSPPPEGPQEIEKRGRFVAEGLVEALDARKGGLGFVEVTIGDKAAHG